MFAIGSMTCVDMGLYWPIKSVRWSESSEAHSSSKSLPTLLWMRRESAWCGSSNVLERCGRSSTHVMVPQEIDPLHPKHSRADAILKCPLSRGEHPHLELPVAYGMSLLALWVLLFDFICVFCNVLSHRWYVFVFSSFFVFCIDFGIMGL